MQALRFRLRRALQIFCFLWYLLESLYVLIQPRVSAVGSASGAPTLRFLVRTSCHVVQAFNSFGVDKLLPDSYVKDHALSCQSADRCRSLQVSTKYICMHSRSRMRGASLQEQTSDEPLRLVNFQVYKTKNKNVSKINMVEFLHTNLCFSEVNYRMAGDGLCVSAGAVGL